MSAEIKKELCVEIEKITDNLIKPFFLKEKSSIFTNIQKIHKEYRFHQRDLDHWINSEIFALMDQFQINYQKIYSQIGEDNNKNFLLKEWINLFIHRSKNEVIESLMQLKQNFFRLARNKNEQLQYKFPEINFKQLVWDAKNMQLEKNDLNQIVGNFAFEFGNSPRSASLEMTINLTEKTAIVPQISRFTYEILEELTKNAEHFTGRSGNITISVSRSTPETVILTVEDNGTGIEKEILDKISKNGFTTRIGGSGKGLGLIKVYIEDMLGGTLTIKSKPGSGTSISMEMPTQN